MTISGKLIVVLMVGALAQYTGLPAWAANLSGAGSTFVSPVFATWADAYKKKTGVSIDYRPVGSVTGIMLIKSNRIDFGASDAPLKAEDLGEAAMIQFPLVIGGVVPVVNVRGIEPGQLKLTGPVLADIYLGKIAYWNDKAIAELNPELELPRQAIVPVDRAGDSGTRYIFSDYLAKVSPEWKRSAGVNRFVQVLSGIGARGNDLVAAFVAARTGTIGYVEYAYAKQRKLAYVLMQNHDRVFVAPNTRSFKSAAANAEWARPRGFQTLLTDQPGTESWPISGSTFMLVYRDQRSSEGPVEMLKFFDWVYRDGTALADDLDYAPIPQNVVQLVENTWVDIRARDGRPVWSGANVPPH
jgi:phosphate transport system substrate-binding protein